MFWDRKTKKKNKYSGRPLTPDAVNAQKLTNDHRRQELRKDTQANIEMIAKYGALACVPLAFIGLVVVDIHTNNMDSMTTHLTGIGGSLVGYLFGKSENKGNE